jgi:hypothetical protein
MQGNGFRSIIVLSLYDVSFATHPLPNHLVLITNRWTATAQINIYVYIYSIQVHNV